MTILTRGLITLRSSLQPFVDGLRAAWQDAAASAVAAAIAWLAARWLFGHPQPIFAAISAIVCLSPGLPSHGRQAVGLMLGVATGIVVGELVLLLLPESPLHLSLLRVTLATFVSMLVAACYGQPPVVPIQAGASAVLVLALGPKSAGLARLEDVGVGVIIGLAFSQVLLTPDPVRIIDRAADNLLLRLAKVFKHLAAALTVQDSSGARRALRSISAVHESLIALSTGIDAARYSARWSLRGRLAADAVTDMAARYDRRAIRLYASSVLLGEAAANALRKGEAPPPQGLADAIQELATRCIGIARGLPPSPTSCALTPGSVAADWHTTIVELQAVSEVLTSLESLDEPVPVTPVQALAAGQLSHRIEAPQEIAKEPPSREAAG